MLDVDGSSSIPGGGSDGCPMMLFVSVAPTLHDDPRAGFEPVVYEFQDGAGEVRLPFACLSRRNTPPPALFCCCHAGQVAIAGHIVSAFYGPLCGDAYNVAETLRRLQITPGAPLLLEVRMRTAELEAAHICFPSLHRLFLCVTQGGSIQGALGDPFPGRQLVLRVTVAHH